MPPPSTSDTDIVADNVTVTWRGARAWVRIDNPPVNATSTKVRAQLLAAIDQAQGADLAILHCAGRTFVAGGDITEFDHSPHPPDLPDVVQALEDSATPFLALLHGTVLGGGLELAMGCAFRLAHPATRFGLPETSVGVIPGAGGTQRAPRLFGWQASVDMACLGRQLGAHEALALGAIDAIEDDPARAAEQFVPFKVTPVSQRPAPAFDEAWWEDMRKMVQKKARGAEAAAAAFDALARATGPFAKGQQAERATHLALRRSPQSRALRHLFLAERAVARPRALRNETPKNLQTIAVVGGGMMGVGIATAALMAGRNVRVIEQDSARATNAQIRIGEQIAGAQARGKITAGDAGAAMRNLSCHTTSEAAANTDLVIEAVFENLAAKQAVFAALAAVVPADTLLATNTSYLDPSHIFADTPYPGRCLGLHFFAPAHVMRLVEVVGLPATTPQTLATAFHLARGLGKIPVQAGICDGFIGNRMLGAYRRAAEYMLADGALPGQIDAAMRGFGMAMGPFEAQDMSGLQIAEANRRREDATRPIEQRYVTLADTLCQQGRLGRRAGAGWYAYDGANAAARDDPDVARIITDYAHAHGLKRHRFDVADIQDRLLAVLANEGARIVEAGIAADDASVDVVKVHGYGFPRWRGGPMHAAEALGKDRICRALDALEADSPHSWIRASRYS